MYQSGKNQSTQDYQVIFLDCEDGLTPFTNSLFDTITRIGWNFKRILLEAENGYYYRESALSILENAVHNPSNFIFNGIAIDLFWIEDYSLDTDEAYIIDILKLLSLKNVYNIVDKEVLMNLPLYTMSSREKDPKRRKEVEIIQDQIQKHLEPLEELGGKVTYYSENDAIDGDVMGIIPLVVDTGLEFIEYFTNGYLRLYVPDEGYQSEQLEGFVRLFESYLNRIEKRTVQVDAQRTGKATLYIFRTNTEDKASLETSLPETINRFDQFMALCKDDPDVAGDFIRSLGISHSEAPALVSKYSKRYTRLLMDTRHERENWEAKFTFQYEERRREIQQQFEVDASELADGKRLTFDSAPVVGLGGILLSANTNAIATIANSNDLAIDGVGGGTQWSDEEKAILGAIRDKLVRSSEAESMSLEADLQLVKDDTAQPQTRKGALRRLRDFAERNKGTIADAAFRAAVEYLPKLLS